MSLIVGLTGSAGSGKSTVARYLAERHGFVRGKFSGALKAAISGILNYAKVDPKTIERMIEGDLKEVPTPIFEGKSPRQAMLSIGTEWGRTHIGYDFWVNIEMRARANDPFVTFEDVRFPNEAAAIFRRGGIIVNVERPGQQVLVSGHESESYHFEADVHLLNNGSLADLFERVDYRILRGEARPQLKAAA